MPDSFHARSTLTVAGQDYDIYRLDAVSGSERLPFSLKILLENLLRHEDGSTVTATDIQALAAWEPQAPATKEIQYRPARVLMQDFTGVPAVVDLAAMREAMRTLGGDADKINPLQTADLVIDHSIQVDDYGHANALTHNVALEFERNQERYRFLKWGQQAFANFQVVPPDTGIVHQVNTEYLTQVIYTQKKQAYFDTLVGTDSHTTMVNGMGVLGWGVGGIEAEASMLGQPISMLIPQVVGVRLTGALQPSVTATDLVLTIVELLRQHGVVGKFVEFYGPAVATLAMGERTTIANMAPEYGATCGLFPIDEITLAFLQLTGRSKAQIELVEAYAKAQGLFGALESATVHYSETVTLDLSTVVPCIAGPRRPQDRVKLTAAVDNFKQACQNMNRPVRSSPVSVQFAGQTYPISDGVIALAALTSCTNTSNPSVMLAAGLVAQQAVARGLTVAPWVKTSLGSGSQAVTRYLQASGLLEPLCQLGFYPVGHGCTTCIGNSGPLRSELSAAIKEHDLTAVAVLSGNRNFEGRIHAEVRMNYLASPPLVVAYALAGRIDCDIASAPLGYDQQGQAVYLQDLWPSEQALAAATAALQPDLFITSYRDVFAGTSAWQQLDAPTGEYFAWDPDSTYIRQPPYFTDITMEPAPIPAINQARCLALLGDSVTTDHISPAGAIKVDSPAGRYLIACGVKPTAFNSYGARRGNHEVMMRGTFAHARLRNRLVPDQEGGITQHLPSGDVLSIYDAAMRYAHDQVPVILLAGKEYGSGSSRDWAAKGPRLLGIRAVIAESYERIHRTNLVCMGILPLQFLASDTAASLGLTGTECYSIAAPELTCNPIPPVTVTITHADGHSQDILAQVRIDTPNEAEYYRHGGILHYVLRHLAAA
jgi:aconitate hydratase